MLAMNSLVSLRSVLWNSTAASLRRSVVSAPHRPCVEISSLTSSNTKAPSNATIGGFPCGSSDSTVTGTTNHPSLPFPVQQQQCRHIHSMRQRKRMAKHPARLRVLSRQQEQEQGSESISAEHQLSSSLSSVRTEKEPTYQPVFEPNLLRNGWSAPPPEQQQLIQQYPFRIERTQNKPFDAAGFLPVYTYMRKDGTKVTTRIKKVSGDVDAFVHELKTVLQLEPNVTIRQRVGGTLELNGNHVRSIKLWLAQLGF